MASVVNRTLNRPDLIVTITKRQMEKMLSGDFDMRAARAAIAAGEIEFSGEIELLGVLRQLLHSPFPPESDTRS
jgi:hypothetical protein